MNKLTEMTGPKSDTSSLENHVKSYVSLSEDEVLALNSLAQYRKIKKNQYLCSPKNFKENANYSTISS